MASKSDQEKLIGRHPVDSGFFSEWLNYEDLPATPKKNHRKLSERKGGRQNAIEQISNWIIIHHLDEKRLGRLKKKKELLGKYGYKNYLKNLKPLPVEEKTKKANAAEILISEYLQTTSKLSLLIYKLRYNPNVDQSMKGDDVLLFNREDLHKKIIVSESKYRSSPSKEVVDFLVNSFKGNKRLPLSITFVAKILSDLGEEELADELETLNTELHKQNIPIVNVGFLLSNLNAAKLVEKHLSTDNRKFVMVSLGINNPGELVEGTFTLANKKL